MPDRAGSARPRGRVRAGSAGLTVVMPAYNEARRIGSALDELFAWLDGEGAAAGLGVVSVLVVDDGSSDTTPELVARRPEAQVADADSAESSDSPPRLRLLRQTHQGKGGAVRAGMLAAKTDLVLFTDADLATPPDQLPLLVAALAEHDVALGSRIQPDGIDRRASQPFHRRALGRLFHGLVALWLTGPVPDTQCGFKAFRRDAAQDLFANQQVSGIAFDAEIIFLARRRGYSLAIVPVAWSDKRGSRMRLSPRLAFAVLWDLLRIRWLHRAAGRAA